MKEFLKDFLAGWPIITMGVFLFFFFSMPYWIGMDAAFISALVFIILCFLLMVYISGRSHRGKF